MIDSIFGFKKPENSPGFVLWQTTVIWQRLIKKALDPYNISQSQFVILAISLWFESLNQEITQGLIISQSKLDKMTVSKSIKNLVERGYVRRFEHHEDTRAKSVCLTEKGKVFSLELIAIVKKIDMDFFGNIKEAERLSLITTLNTLISIRKDQDE